MYKNTSLMTLTPRWPLYDDSRSIDSILSISSSLHLDYISSYMNGLHVKPSLDVTKDINLMVLSVKTYFRQLSIANSILTFILANRINTFFFFKLFSNCINFLQVRIRLRSSILVYCKGSFSKFLIQKIWVSSRFIYC